MQGGRRFMPRAGQAVLLPPIGGAPAGGMSRAASQRRSVDAAHRLPKEEKRRRLSSERRRRTAAESEAARLRTEIGSLERQPPPNAVARGGPGLPLPPRLTTDYLRRLEEQAAPGPWEPGASNGPAAEVLQWKRLIRRCEKRQMMEELDEERGVKVTQGAYCRKDAQNQFHSLARARQALAREGKSSLVFGGRIEP
mmetsp:Transcript_134486/g.417967  ORF Transcript_134486/g.417967 Transcript_134486/m.417967 type:complete len:196 (+) Transcript_134486:54-641(+)